MKKNNYIISFLSILVSIATAQDKPNLVVVYTDEHNLRTIGAYRDMQSKKVAEPWGDSVVVDTPNIDRLANEGSIWTSFYTVAPLCTPSRASFMTGLYPKSTGAHLNHNAMYDTMTTWAKVLKQRGYHTGYTGKWHLNGNEKPGWNSGKKYGFIDNKWQYNRGHWKFFEDHPTLGPQAYEWTDESEAKFAKTIDKNYVTDFLMDRGIEIMQDAINQDKPFAVMISIPDPHSPNIVRPPYNSMYQHFKYEVPMTGKAALKKKPALPGWSAINLDVSEASATIKAMESDPIRHGYYTNIFGMVKLIDDQVEKLFEFLESNGVSDNTIVVFTSDHGDQLGEHAKHNKGRPYETSAGVPFLMRWPNGIEAGKVINTAYTSVDFAPTILSMMGITNPNMEFHGIDGSKEVLSPDKNTDSYMTKKQTRFITDSATSKWATAVRDDFKLTLSNGEPWFFDLSTDPNELHNVYTNANYTSIIEEMQSDLYDAMFQHQFPLAENEVIFFSQPSCWDSRSQIAAWNKRLCNELTNIKFSPACTWRKIYEECPNACNRCCVDSPGKIFINGQLKTCNEVSEHCENKKVQHFCPVKCNTCPNQRSISTEDEEEEEASNLNEFEEDDDLRLL